MMHRDHGTIATPWLAGPILSIIMILLGLSDPALARGVSILTLDGLGPVRLGMTVKEVEQALGASLGAPSPQDSPECWIGDGPVPGINYMIENGRLTRIDILGNLPGVHPAVITASGVTLGDPLSKARHAYQARAKEEPNFYEPTDPVVVIEGQNPHRALKLFTEKSMIWLMSTGLFPSIDYPEGCE